MPILHNGREEPTFTELPMDGTIYHCIDGNCGNYCTQPWELKRQGVPYCPHCNVPLKRGVKRDVLEYRARTYGVFPDKQTCEAIGLIDLAKEMRISLWDNEKQCMWEPPKKK